MTEPRDVPVIFSAPMVLALLDGRKTMTRRLAWRDIPTPKANSRIEWRRPYPRAKFAQAPTPWQRVKPGDRLWVRETAWYDRDVIPALGALRCFFEGGAVRISDGRSGQGPGHPDSHTAEIFKLNTSLVQRPSIHMPRWASRLTLVVTAVKIERLQKITDADCIAEGIEKVDGGFGVRSPDNPDGWWHIVDTPRAAFKILWLKIHGGPAWDANPECVALTFTVHKQNIDAFKEAA